MSQDRSSSIFNASQVEIFILMIFVLLIITQIMTENEKNYDKWTINLAKENDALKKDNADLKKDNTDLIIDNKYLFSDFKEILKEYNDLKKEFSGEKAEKVYGALIKWIKI